MDFLELTDNSSMILDKDLSTWPDSIQQAFETKFPDLANFSPTVELVKVDKRGYGFGRITVRRGSISLFFPIIIDQFKIQPLDTFILNDRYFPAQKSILNLVFKGTFGQVAARTSDDQRISQSMTNYLFSPYYFPVGVKNATILPTEYKLDPIKTKNFLTKLAFSLSSDSVKELIAKINKPEILKLIKGIPTLTEFFSTLKNVPSNSVLATRAAAMFPKNIVQFRYDNGNYYVLLNSSDMFVPSEFQLPAGNVRDAVRQLLGVTDDSVINEIIENVANDGMLTATLPTFRTGVIKIINDQSPLKPSIITETGNALVQDAYGKYRAGTVFTKIKKINDFLYPSGPSRDDGIPFHSNKTDELPEKKINYNVYVDSAVGMIAEKFIGFKVSDRSEIPITFPEAGNMGFLFNDKDSTISEPFLIIKLVEKIDRKDEIYGKDPLIKTEYVMHIQTLAGEPHTITLRKDDPRIHFIRIKKLVEAGTDINLSNPDNILMITISYDSGKFAMEVPIDMNSWTSEAFGEYAPIKRFNFDLLSPSDLDFILVSGGASVKEAAAIRNYVVKNKIAKIAGLKFNKPIKREIRLKYASMLKEAIPKVDPELFKYAAEAIDDELTVSEIFGLNLMTPENISEFIDNIPTYNLILHNISKFIIFARMALKNQNLEPMLKVRDNLLNIIQTLILLNYKLNGMKSSEIVEQDL